MLLGRSDVSEAASGAAGRKVTGRPQTKALASEQSLPVSLPALGGARRGRAGRIVLIRASLRRRLRCRFKALPWWHRGEEQPAVGLLPALPEGLAQEALLPSPGPPGGRLRSPPPAPVVRSGPLARLSQWGRGAWSEWGH